VKVFVFDLLPYAENLEHLKNGATELPWPLAKSHFKPEVAVRTYAEHLDAWELIDKLGYDGIGFNEQHTSPYGLMNSPNLVAASAAQRTKRLKLLIYGNLLPVHEPLRLAEELAMLDCLSNGRVISGFARGIPREHNVYNVPLSESRARFEEAWEIIRRAWTEEVFSYEGQFWKYRDVAIWPRPVQQPHPPVWVPVTASKETIEWAGKHNVPITPGLGAHRGVREDVIRYYARQLEQHGHAARAVVRARPHHRRVGIDIAGRNAFDRGPVSRATKEGVGEHSGAGQREDDIGQVLSSDTVKIDDGYEASKLRVVVAWLWLKLTTGGSDAPRDHCRTTSVPLRREQPSL